METQEQDNSQASSNRNACSTPIQSIFEEPPAYFDISTIHGVIDKDNVSSGTNSDMMTSEETSDSQQDDSDDEDDSEETNTVHSIDQFNVIPSNTELDPSHYISGFLYNGKQNLTSLNCVRNYKRILNQQNISFNINDSNFVHFKPKHFNDPNNLYAKLLNSYRDVPNIVHDLYQSTTKNVSIQILQFILDLMGLQEFHLAERFNNMELRHLSPLIGEIHQMALTSESIKSAQFVLGIFSTNFDVLHLSIYCFWVEFGATFCRNSGAVMDIVLDFLRLMCRSRIRAFRHTIGAIVAKILTGLAMALVENRDSEQQIKNWISTAYQIFEKNCVINDRSCRSLRIECTAEMADWILIEPDLFYRELRTFKYLRRMCYDEYFKVRQTALYVYSQLIHCEKLQNVIEDVHHFNIIHRRTNDIKATVKQRAFLVCCVFFKQFPNISVQPNVEQSFVNGVLNENFNVAQTALCCLQINIKNNPEIRNDTDVLLALCRYFQKFTETFVISLVVEIGLKSFFPQLTNWKLFIAILTNDQYSIQIRLEIQELFTECAYQYLTGTPTVEIRKEVDRTNDKNLTDEEHVNIAELLLDHAFELIEIFNENDDAIARFLQVLRILKYEHLSEDRIKDLNNILRYYTDLYTVEIPFSFKLLCEIIRLFEHVYNRVPQFEEQISIFVNSAQKTFLKAVTTNILPKLKELPERTPDKNSDDICLKLAVLLKYFPKFYISNTMYWIIHTMTKLPTVCHENLRLHKHLIDCCSHFLIIQCSKAFHDHFVTTTVEPFRTNMDDDNDDDDEIDIDRLGRVCKLFVEFCYQIIDESKYYDLAGCIFVNIVSMYTQIAYGMCKLEFIVKYKLNFTHKFEKCILHFCKTYVILNSGNNDVSESRRAHYLRSTVNLCVLGVLPIKVLIVILQIYGSCAAYDVIYKEFFTCMNKKYPTACPMIIYFTLTHYYNTLLATHCVHSIHSVWMQKIRCLAEKFALLKEMRTNENILLIMDKSIHFSLASAQNIHFLGLVKPFVSHLDGDQLCFILDQLHTNYGHEESLQIRQFFQLLRNQQRSQRRRIKKATRRLVRQQTIEESFAVSTLTTTTVNHQVSSINRNGAANVNSTNEPTIPDNEHIEDSSDSSVTNPRTSPRHLTIDDSSDDDTNMSIN